MAKGCCNVLYFYLRKYIATIRDLHLKNHIHCEKLEQIKKFGTFNIKYEGPKIWNSLSEDDKKLSVSELKNYCKIAIY